MQTGLQRRGLWAVLALLVGVRVLAMVVLAPTLDFTREGNAIHGSEAYDEYAQNLLASGVYGRVLGVPDAEIPPLYSYALAVVYGTLGRSYAAVGAFHILLDVLSALLLYDVARRLLGGWVGVLSVAFFACYPYLVFQNLTVIDTPFWILLLHAFLWLVVLIREAPALDRRTLGLGVLAGVALGLGTLTRPITPPLALLVALWFLFCLPFLQAFLRLLPIALVSVLCVGAWIARNWLVFGAFIPMTTTSGSNFWQGNSAWTLPVFKAGYDVQWTAPQVDYPPKSREADAQRVALALQFLRENPAQVPELLWVKFLVHWNPNITPLYNPRPNERWELAEDGTLRILPADASITGVTSANVAYNDSLLDRVGRPLHLAYFGALLLLAGVGFVLSWRVWREASLLWFVQLSMTLMYVAFHPSTRYRSPSDPLLFVLAAYALVWLWGRYRGGFTPAPHKESASA